MKRGTIWMVKGPGPASVVRYCRRSAEAEAQRLARLHPGTKFHVLKSVACHREPAVSAKRATQPDDAGAIPACEEA